MEGTRASSLAGQLHQAEINVRESKEGGRLSRKQNAVLAGVALIGLGIVGLAMKKAGLSPQGMVAGLTLLTGASGVGYLTIAAGVKAKSNIDQMLADNQFDKLCQQANNEIGKTPGFSKSLAKELNDVAANESIQTLKQNAEFKESIENVQKPRYTLKTNEILQGKDTRFGDLSSLAPENIIR
jgi:hypothetical protein